MEALKYYPEISSWKKNRAGKCQLSIRFDWSGNCAGNKPLNIEIRPEDWEREAKRVRHSCQQAELINLIIENHLNKHLNYFLRRKAFNLPLNENLVRKYVRSGSGLEDFYEYTEQVLTHKKLKDGNGYDEETRRRYRDEIKKMMQFVPVRQLVSWYCISDQGDFFATTIPANVLPARPSISAATFSSTQI